MSESAPHPDCPPELLAPAGNWECARAAIANGADAIYFGLDRFNARLRADNFRIDDLPALMHFLHGHGAKGYVTMNTLIFPGEMQDALDYAARLDLAGVDGVIVQDLGFAALLSDWKRDDPSIRLELHASTQMTLSSGEGLAFVGRFLDLQRAVLARELSLKDIGACAEDVPVPMEVFVHGALCVAYSGQCLTSESLGQRSANRGECAQACRMPYAIVCDGRQVPLGERRYVLSPQDLCAVDRIADLVRLGVKSYKIEGRLKSPEYVAAVTRAYRKALDAAVAGLPPGHAVNNEHRYAMQMAFSRGFSTGWLDGTNHPLLTHGRHGKKRGAFTGIVQGVGRGWVDVAMNGAPPVAPGDGFVFDSGSDRNDEQGGRIWKVERNRLFFHGRGSHIDWNRVKPGQKIWKTDDPALNDHLRKTWLGLPAVGGRPVSIRCTGNLGAPLTLECEGVTVKTGALLERAHQRPLTPQMVREQLSRLGGTGFTLNECLVDLPDGLIIPVSAINAARRKLVDALSSKAPASPRSHSVPVIPIKSEAAGEPILSVLCRRLEQIAPVLEQGVDIIYLDFEDLRQCREGVRLAREASPKTAVFLATPRIQKPGETGYLRQIERAEPDGVLVRNLGAAEWFFESSLRRIADFSLNTANPWTADVLMREGCFERVTISYDLNANQVADLLRQASPCWFELTIHQHMPMFHMEHCVFCTFLSEGNNFTNCGRPCERHRVELRDRVGQLHPLRADAACRNTLFNGRAQTGAMHYPLFRSLGLDRYRLELLDETPAEAGRLARHYTDLISGRLLPVNLLHAIGASDRLGITSLPE